MSLQSRQRSFLSGDVTVFSSKHFEDSEPAAQSFSQLHSWEKKPNFLITASFLSQNIRFILVNTLGLKWGTVLWNTVWSQNDYLSVFKVFFFLNVLIWPSDGASSQLSTHIFTLPLLSQNHQPVNDETVEQLRRFNAPWSRSPHYTCNVLMVLKKGSKRCVNDASQFSMDYYSLTKAEI